MVTPIETRCSQITVELTTSGDMGSLAPIYILTAVITIVVSEHGSSSHAWHRLIHVQLTRFSAIQRNSNDIQRYVSAISYDFNAMLPWLWSTLPPTLIKYVFKYVFYR